MLKFSTNFGVFLLEAAQNYLDLNTWRSEISSDHNFNECTLILKQFLMLGCSGFFLAYEGMYLREDIAIMHFCSI